MFDIVGSVFTFVILLTMSLIIYSSFLGAKKLVRVIANKGRVEKEN